MKSSAISALFLGPLALAAALAEIETRQEELAECCYLWKDSVRWSQQSTCMTLNQMVGMLTREHFKLQVGNSQLFRSTSLSQQDIGEPGSWCIAQIER